MATTITEIAKRLNVSHSTVSRVLNGRGKQYASEQTASQIHRLAIELNYRPNRLANGLLRGKTFVIGVVMGRCNNSYMGGILEGIRVAAAAHGYQILLGRAYNYDGDEASQVRLLLDYRVDGLICFADRWDRTEIVHWLDEVLAMHMPCAIVDSHAFADRADSIASDDVQGAKMATQHLIDIGHRKIGHIGAGDLRATSTERRQGYIEALKEAGIEVVPGLIDGWAYAKDSAIESAEFFLGLKPHPTALFAASDGLAFWACEVLKARGLRVPDDIAMVGYGNQELGEGMGLTTIDQAPGTIGGKAVERVLYRMENPDARPEAIPVNTTLIVRGSTVPRV